MLKQVILGMAVFGTLATANARVHRHEERPDARLYICSDIRAMVAEDGAVLVQTGDWTFERIVRGMSFCSNAGDETTRPAYIQTSDGTCFAGWRCVQDNRGSGN